jgi:hypothetical protein
MAIGTLGTIVQHVHLEGAKLVNAFNSKNFTGAFCAALTGLGR